jgi:amino acid adenylation domain-containing protein
LKKLQVDAARSQTDLDRIRAESGLSWSQIPIWIGQSFHPASPLYNMAFAFVLEARVDTGAFRTAWRTVVAGSDALRTSVDARGAIGVRRLRPSASETELLDFSERASPEDAFRAWARDRCARVLPLDGLLVDSVLVRLAEHRCGWYLNQHHLVTDATSTVLLFRKVAAEYAAATTPAGSTDAIPSLEPYYATARSIESFPNPTLRNEASRHWAQRLRLDRLTPFYGRVARPASTASERLTIALDEPASRRLKSIVEEPGFLSFTPDISTFALFATALAAWLHRVGGRHELGFDAPAHNRPTAASKRSLGLFIEMFPFCVEVTAGDSFRELARKCLAETQLFLRLALPGTNAPSGAAASNVVLNFFSGTFGGFAGVPVSSEWIHSGESDSVHALRLQVHDYDASGRYTLHFDFNEQVFPSALRRRAIAHFERLFSALLEDPDQPISGVDLLTDDEREELLVRYNATAMPPLPVRPVSELVKEQAARTPDRVALRHGPEELTFGELIRDVRTAAAQLVRIGVQPGEPVAVLMKRSIDAVVAILAVLEARAAYVPLDAAYPHERIRHIVEDCGATRLIVRDHLTPALASKGCTSITLEDLLRADGPVVSLDPPRPDDLAYIIYTSGSTGAPKGVLVEHRGLSDYLEWASRQYVRGDALVFPLFTSLAFDLTVTSLYLPLMTGGTLVVYEESEGHADAALMNVIGENAIDFVKLTPSHLSLLKHIDLSSSRIRRIVVGGEDFRTQLAATIVAQFPHPVEMYNEYGPTEAVVGCMVHRYDSALDTALSVPIGRPADHVQLFVLNEAMVPVPAGVAGELCISRYGLARGYRGQTGAGGGGFVAHPFREGERLYRTGDLARFNDSGTLDYLGRIDRQLKVSGMRVEPAEIETILLGHDAVQECVVMAHVREISARSEGRDGVVYCERCGLPSNFPDAVFDVDGVCHVCRSFETIKDRARAYFRGMDDLRALFVESAARRGASHDCMVLLSGGKDSTYALCRLVEMGLRVYAFSFDNGYISEQAKENIRRVVAALAVDHEFATAPAMDAIFRDSLTRFSNVCNGCFKTIYTLSMNRAHELGIPIIVTGLSRGQFFETRLTADLFRDDRCSPEQVDAAVLAARKAYHRLDDQVSRSLDVRIFQDDRVFEEVRFVDFYRYCDAGLDEILSYLKRTVPWMRPSDTGRSTNCLINEVGIYIHTKERGYHNYALPYSWDVRLAHKTRHEALDELRDELDVPRVRRILSDIGYDEDRLTGDAAQVTLAAYYVGSPDASEADLRRHLARSLPSALIPQRFIRVEAIPLTPNGKIDEVALRGAAGSASPSVALDVVAPEGAVEERIAAIWEDVLRTGRVGTHTSFFELGGTSLGAMEVALRICNEFDVDLPLQTVFTCPTVAQLAQAVEDLILQEVEALSDEEAERLAGGHDAET